MRFENTQIDGQVIDFTRLTEIMDELGFVLAGQWDYERVTFDYKFEMGNDYYLRVQAFAIEGDIGSRHANVKLLTPILGKHYYPHGVEYGEDEYFPNKVIQKSNELLQQLSTTLDSLVKEES